VETVAHLEPVAFVSVDWASEAHAVCVLGTDGRKSRSFQVKSAGTASRSW